jgi:stage V sporulation protein G
MEVTGVSVFPRNEDRLKAFVTVTFDHCFIVRDLKIIRGNRDLFVAMPSKRKKDGVFAEVAHPLNAETRAMIENAVLEAYYRALEQPAAHLASNEE